MKVIVTGATGFVGGEVLRQCILNPTITTIFVLSRKEPAPELTKSDKVRVIIHKDYEQYPESLLSQLKGTEACLWAIGGKRADFPDLATAKKVNINYTIAAAKAFAEHLMPELGPGKTFRFVLCGGAWAETDPNKWIFPLRETRLIKGEIEQKLFALSDQTKHRFQAFAVRPAGIAPIPPGIKFTILSYLLDCCSVDELTISMVDFALNGSPDRMILDVKEIPQRGKKLLAQRT